MQAEDFTGIVINEILPSPEGPDAQKEWIEIFNENDFKVDISFWKIKDTEGRTKTYTFPKETRIEAEGFLVLERPKTKITLNNDGDGLELIQPDGKVINEVHYERALEGKSFSKIDDDWMWSSNLTPGAENSLPQAKNKIGQIEGETLTGTLSQTFPEGPGSRNFFFIFSIALILALISGALILILKKKIGKKDKIEISAKF